MLDALRPVLGDHEAHRISGGDICRAFRVTLSDRVLFAKTPNRRDPWLLPVEASGLRAIAAEVPGLTPDVVHVDADWLVLEWIDEQAPSPGAAGQFGHRLAQLHAAPAAAFGTGPDHGRIGSLAMPAGAFPTWPQMYSELRLRPLLGSDLPRCQDLADALLDEPEWAGPAEPPSLLHGDLWSGNLLWAQRPRLVDPACHVGHRETDLAMLALFGTPLLADILAAYQQVHPLSPDWQRRVGLHQIWPLLVHHRLFGGGYGHRAERIAAGYLRG